MAEVLNVVLRFVYAGEEEEGWALYDKVYELSDKEEVRARVLTLLKDEPVYQFICNNKRQIIIDDLVIARERCIPRP